MPWLFLILAGLCEIVWAIGLKYSHGFTRTTASVITIVVMLLSFVLLAKAMRDLPLGTAYCVWTGIGAVGTTIYGIWKFDEPRDAIRIISIMLVILGIVGLKLASGEKGDSHVNTSERE